MVKSVSRHRPLVELGYVGSSPSTWLRWGDQSVRYTLDRTHKECCTHPESSVPSHHLQGGRIWRYSWAASHKFDVLGQYFTKAAVCLLTYESSATRMGFSTGWEILAHGIRAHSICFLLYPLPPVSGVFLGLFDLWVWLSSNIRKLSQYTT